MQTMVELSLPKTQIAVTFGVSRQTPTRPRGKLARPRTPRGLQADGYRALVRRRSGEAGQQSATLSSCS